MKEFYVYMMTNRSRVVLYTGVTSKLEGRVWEPKNYVMKGFTSKYKLDCLVHYEHFRIPFQQSRAKRKSKPGGVRRKTNWCES